MLMRAAIQPACRMPIRKGLWWNRSNGGATGYIPIEFGRLGCCVYGDIHKILWGGVGGHGVGIYYFSSCVLYYFL